MQSGLLIFLFLLRSLAVNSAPAEESSTTPELSLGDKIFKKQDECEGIISDTIDEIFDDEDSDLHDFPIPDDSYYDCKEYLDKMKREYMSANHIEKSTYPEFFPLRLSDGTLEIVSVPDKEGEERKEMEFDVNEELCVTSRKCARIMDLMDGDKEKEKLYSERLGHCSVLLNDIKIKYIKEKGLDEKKLKDEGGLSVMCTGKSILLPLPHMMNNLDYHKIQSDLHPGEESTSPVAEKPVPVVESPSEEHKEDQIPVVEAPKHVEGSSSSAYVEKANFVYCVLILLVSFKLM